MFQRSTTALDFYDDLAHLIVDQANWSQETFGSDSERGPIGALKHLAKEAEEVQLALDAGPEETLEELADCFLLFLDATRRAGFKIGDVLDASKAKMVKNKARTWPKPTSDEPVEHVR